MYKNIFEKYSGKTFFKMDSQKILFKNIAEILDGLCYIFNIQESHSQTRPLSMAV